MLPSHITIHHFPLIWLVLINIIEHQHHHVFNTQHWAAAEGQRSHCIRQLHNLTHKTGNSVSSSNSNLTVWKMICSADLIIITGSSVVYNLLHLLSSCSEEWLDKRGSVRETEDRKRSQTAEIGRCRGRKREEEHLPILLPAEECLSPQAAQYETRSQLQLMVKWSICLDCIAVGFPPSEAGFRSRSRSGNELIYGPPDPSTHGLPVLHGSLGTLSISATKTKQ